ncbi:hypothetical protein HOY82DRAFT_672411 [Tuber indicum]|nr:hypothetical protein HOY82DRAFT_672411 [Tuber indicum]
MLKKVLASVSKSRDPIIIIAGGFASHATGIMCGRQIGPYAVGGSKKCPTTEQSLHTGQRTEKEMPTDDHVLSRTTNLIPSLEGSG